MGDAPLLARAPDNVLVVVTRRIGDVLLATPVLRSLKRAWPHAAIDVLVFEGTAGFVAANRDVRRVLTVPERPRLLDHLRLAAGIVRRYDLALSLVPGDRPTLYAYLAGRRRAGLLAPTRKDAWKRRLLDRWVPFDNVDTHTVRMHLALLDAVGIARFGEIVAARTADDDARAREALEPLGGAPYAVLHAYPKFRYKMWTEEGWAELAAWLEQRGLRVVLTGGPDDADRGYVARLAAHMPGALDLGGRLSLGSVASVISGAALYVGADTSVTHAAAGMGVPTVALFGPTNPVKWGPWPAAHDTDRNPWQRRGSQIAGNVALVQGAGPCVPCAEEGCDKHVESESRCLTTMSAATVIAAAEAMLSRRSS